MPNLVTLISVVYDNYSTLQLNCNRWLYEETNGDYPCDWIVGVNNEKDLANLPFVNGKYREIVPCIHDVRKMSDKKNDSLFNVSTAHGMAINLLLEKVDSRYVLVLDADFFVVYKNWVERLVSQMKEHELAFFGSTWFPGHYKKYRYFPSVHFMLIDLHKVDKNQLDFRPDHTTDRYVLKNSDNNNKPSYSIPILDKTKALITKRNTVGISRDTGYRIYQRYGGDRRFTRQTLVCAYRPYDEKHLLGKAKFLIMEALEKMLQEDKRFLPRRDTYSLKTFSDYGKPDLYSKGWEEFFLDGDIFAFHMRNTQRYREIKRRQDVHKTTDSELKEILEVFTV